MMKPKIILAAVVITAIVIILIQNTQVVTVRLFFWKVSMSQILLMSLTLLFGLVIGFIAATFFNKRHKKID